MTLRKLLEAYLQMDNPDLDAPLDLTCEGKRLNDFYIRVFGGCSSAIVQIYPTDETRLGGKYRLKLSR